MNRPAAAWFAGLLVGAATATAAWVRLAGHPAAGAIDRQVERAAAQAYAHMIGADLSIEERRQRAARAQLVAIRLGIRALEALPTREWDDEEGMPSGSHREGTQERRKADTGSGGGSEPARPGEWPTASSDSFSTRDSW